MQPHASSPNMIALDAEMPLLALALPVADAANAAGRHRGHAASYNHRGEIAHEVELSQTPS